MGRVQDTDRPHSKTRAAISPQVCGLFIDSNHRVAHANSFGP